MLSKIHIVHYMDPNRNVLHGTTIWLKHNIDGKDIFVGGLDGIYSIQASNGPQKVTF